MCKGICHLYNYMLTLSLYMHFEYWLLHIFWDPDLHMAIQSSMVERGVLFSVHAVDIYFQKTTTNRITFQRLTHGEVCKSSMSSCSHTVIRYRSIGTIYNNYRINAVQSHFDMLRTLWKTYFNLYSFTYHDRLIKWIACMVSY